jgi:manganese transport protein
MKKRCNTPSIWEGKTPTTLIHVVETVGAIVYGSSIKDHETTVDEQLLYEYTRLLSDKGFFGTNPTRFGKPGKAIAKIINEGQFDLLIMGTHGHGNFKDLIFGTTVGNVRHAVSIPLFIIKN